MTVSLSQPQLVQESAAHHFRLPWLGGDPLKIHPVVEAGGVAHAPSDPEHDGGPFGVCKTVRHSQVPACRPERVFHSRDHATLAGDKELWFEWHAPVHRFVGRAASSSFATAVGSGSVKSIIYSANGLNPQPCGTRSRTHAQSMGARG